MISLASTQIYQIVFQYYYNVKCKMGSIPLPVRLIIPRLWNLLQIRIVVLVVPIPVPSIEVVLVLLIVLVPEHLYESSLRVLPLLHFVGPDQHVRTELICLEGEEAQARRDDRLVRDVCNPGSEAHRPPGCIVVRMLWYQVSGSRPVASLPLLFVAASTRPC